MIWTIQFHGSPGLRPLGAVSAVLASVALCGCGPSSSTEVSPPTKEIRGAPIQNIATKSADASNDRSTNAPGSSPAATRTSSPTTVNAPAPAGGEGALLSFEQLAGYTFEVSDELLGPVTNDLAVAAEKTNSQIPDSIKSYDKKKVALKGFMLPLKVEGGLVTEMLIMKDQSMCCYGATPRINDWVSVKMKKKGVRPTMDLPVTLHGTMNIGEMRENGYLVGIYSMDGESMEAPDVD